MSGSAFLPDEAATLAFATRAAAALPAKGEPLVAYLEGDLGTGKTTFARGLLRALGEAGPVRSPSYALLASYELPGGVVHHLDLYRLHDPEELHALALRDLLPESRLWLIEWPGRGGNRLPRADVRLDWAVEGAGRRVEAASLSPKGNQWLAGFIAGRPS